MKAVLLARFGLAANAFGQILRVSEIDAVLREQTELKAFDITLRNRHGEIVDAVSARGAHVRPDGSLAPAELLNPEVLWAGELPS